MLKNNFNNQQNNYLKTKKSLYHNLDNSQTMQPIIQLNDFNEIIDLIEKFWYNINNLIEWKILEVGYCGKDFFLNYRSDSDKEIDWEKIPTSRDILEHILLSIGTYLPILMFLDDDCMGAIECIHTQPILRIIKLLFEKHLLTKEEFLFIIKPNQQKCSQPVQFVLPKILYNKVAYLLQLNKVQEDDKYIILESNNPIDLWLLFKLYHKEASYYISHYMEKLYLSKIYPPIIFNKNYE